MLRMFAHAVLHPDNAPGSEIPPSSHTRPELRGRVGLKISFSATTEISPCEVTMNAPRGRDPRRALPRARRPLCSGLGSRSG